MFLIIQGGKYVVFKRLLCCPLTDNNILINLFIKDFKGKIFTNGRPAPISYADLILGIIGMLKY